MSFSRWPALPDPDDNDLPKRLKQVEDTPGVAEIQGAGTDHNTPASPAKEFP